MFVRPHWSRGFFCDAGSGALSVNAPLPMAYVRVDHAIR